MIVFVDAKHNVFIENNCNWNEGEKMPIQWEKIGLKPNNWIVCYQLFK